jgi:hypothetical protein
VQAPKPINLDSEDMPGYLYDNAEDRFFDENGKTVEPLDMLEEMYSKHLRTLGRAFRFRWGMGSIGIMVRQTVVWKGQDLAMWALVKCYDVEVADEKKGSIRNPLREYKYRDFRRVTEQEGERSHFFGFQTSQKSFFTNLSIVAIAFLVFYYWIPRTDLLRTIYHNTALSTAALVFAFLLADKIAPWLLFGAVVALS